jgi:hypothetical protein
VKNLAHTLARGEPKHKHREGLPWMQAEVMVPHGDWGMVAVDGVPAVGKACLRCLGFPLPCLLGPCVAVCGVCGTSCKRPVGSGPGGFWQFALNMGPFGPVLGKADKKRQPPAQNEMKRD